jgi:hypothetical protein
MKKADWHRDGAEALDGHMSDATLEGLRQTDRNAVTSPNTQAREGIGQLSGSMVHIAKRMGPNSVLRWHEHCDPTFRRSPTKACGSDVVPGRQRS